MKALHLVLASVASWSTCAFVTGCGSGGGYRGAFTENGQGGAQGALAGAGAGGALGAGAGAGGALGGQGMAGDAGSGGEGIGGGQAGNAGEAAGMAGLSGGGNAGAASDAGAGGLASGGAMSGASGAGIGAGSGGTGNGGTSGAGSGGMAGSGGPLGTCAERCNGDSDCRIFGFDQGYRCNAGTHRCERFAEPCRTSVECLPEASFWIFNCTTDQDCFFFSDDLCVDVGGVGRCARLAPSAGCESPNANETTLPRFGAAGSALVCANASQTCAEGTCVPGCATNSDCLPVRNGSVCDTGTHLCRCVRDEDCGGPGVSHCNVATGGCECSSARDCEEVPNANVCASGRCGCTAASACNDDRTFSGTTYVCE